MGDFFKQKWWAVVIILLLVANIATLVLLWSGGRASQPPAPPPPPNDVQRDEPPPFIPHELHFTSGQQQQYRQLFQKHQQQVRIVKDSIRVAKEAMFALLDNKATTEADVKAQAEKAAALQQQLDVLTFEHFQQLKGICTLEQQQNFSKVIQSAIERMAPPPQPPPPPGQEH